MIIDNLFNRKPTIVESYDEEDLADQVYAEFEMIYPKLARRADERTIHAAIIDVLNYGGDSNPSALAQDVARAVRRDMQQDIAEGAVKELSGDLKTMSNQEFQSHYKMTKDQARASLKNKNESRGVRGVGGARSRENDENDKIDAMLRQQDQQRRDYEQTGKFWLKQKDTQQHISDAMVGKAAANTAAVELLKQRPELRGNLVITAYGPGESQGVAEGEYNPDTFVGKKGTYKGYGITQEGPSQWGISSSARKFTTLNAAKRHIDKNLVAEGSRDDDEYGPKAREEWLKQQAYEKEYNKKKPSTPVKPVNKNKEQGVAEGGFPKKVSKKEVDKFQKKSCNL
jgi:hypothetical protein